MVFMPGEGWQRCQRLRSESYAAPSAWAACLTGCDAMRHVATAVPHVLQRSALLTPFPTLDCKWASCVMAVILRHSDTNMQRCIRRVNSRGLPFILIQHLTCRSVCSHLDPIYRSTASCAFGSTPGVHVDACQADMGPSEPRADDILKFWYVHGASALRHLTGWSCGSSVGALHMHAIDIFTTPVRTLMRCCHAQAR